MYPGSRNPIIGADMPRITDPNYPLTAATEAYVIVTNPADEGPDIVRWFASTRDAAIYASDYAQRYAMFVVHHTPADGNGAIMVGFDCRF